MKFITTVVPLFFLLLAVNATAASGDESNGAADSATESASDARLAVSLETARAEAVVLHEAIHSALRVTHDRYYQEDEGLVIPAAAMKDVFADLKQRRNITLRWLVVEGQAMNTDHVAQNEFEKAAVKALKSGKPSHEQIQDGVYRRAAPIILSNHCLKCHVPDRKNTRERTAGLIISIPVREDGDSENGQ